jgi:Tetracyclin repressor-like, C-terminal domain
LRPEAPNPATSASTRALAVPDTGSWAGDVERFARRLAAFFDDPVEAGQNALMASGAYPEYTEAVLAHYESLLAGWRAAVDRARARGELADGVDADAVLVTTLGSPLLLVPLLFRRTITRAEVDGVIALVLRATAR